MFTETDVIGILGRRGCGKTVLGKKIQTVYPRKIIFDTLGEYSQKDGIICRDFEDFSSKIYFCKKDGINFFSLIYQFNPENRENRSEFDEAMRVLWYFGNVHVVIEEIQNFSNPNYVSHWLSQHLTTGRHKNISLLFTTQMPRFCNKALISQANHVFFGTLHEKNDLDYARTILDDRAKELPFLPSRKFLYFRLGDKIKLVSNSLDP